MNCGKRYELEQISQRAASAIWKYADEHGMSVASVERKIGISNGLVRNWQNGNSTPSSYPLKRMCEHGIDVVWILTGKKGG